MYVSMYVSPLSVLNSLFMVVHVLGLLYRNVSLSNQPEITDEQLFEVNNTLGQMLCFTHVQSQVHFIK